MGISEVYRTLWRHRLLVVVMTCIVVGTAFALTARQTKLYTASSLVRVQQTVRNQEEAFGALLTGERLARTYEHIAETGSVRDEVETRLRGKATDDAVVIDAEQLSNLELLRISATDRDPRVAAKVANAVPLALASFIEKTGTFRDRITTVERASVPTEPSSPNVPLNLAIALMVGLILSSGLVLLKETVADRIEEADELEKLTGHPVLATIPNLRFAPLESVVPARSETKPVESMPSRSRRVRTVEPTESKRPAEVAEAEPTARWGIRG
jgi:capsular polysaccharide biosynthesis protein